MHGTQDTRGYLRRLCKLVSNENKAFPNVLLQSKVCLFMNAHFRNRCKWPPLDLTPAQQQSKQPLICRHYVAWHARACSSPPTPPTLPSLFPPSSHSCSYGGEGNGAVSSGFDLLTRGAPPESRCRVPLTEVPLSHNICTGARLMHGADDTGIDVNRRSSWTGKDRQVKTRLTRNRSNRKLAWSWWPSQRIAPSFVR